MSDWLVDGVLEESKVSKCLFECRRWPTAEAMGCMAEKVTTKPLIDWAIAG